jgi:hypothetical protein
VDGEQAGLSAHLIFVIPAKAGIQRYFQHAVDFVFAAQRNLFINWIPAFAGMT